ncbi:MAG: amidohydrolase [Flavobacterium sp.]|nr:amidohydrolase [Flavobacterium sp.]
MLKVAFIQTSLAWEDPRKNRENFSNKFAGLKTHADLVVLPEMFTTGFSMNAAPLAEDHDGETLAWMLSSARENKFAITGSVIIKEGSKYFNRLYFVTPNADVYKYDKRHLFSLAGEEKVYTAGSDKLIVDYKGWRICPLVCYDLRFPVFARNVENYDLLLFVANWPETRIHAWNTLLKARAIENMAYVVGVNCTGLDGNGHLYTGSSQVLDYLGINLTESTADEIVEIVGLSQEKLQNAREKFGFLNDRDHFTLD